MSQTWQFSFSEVHQLKLLHWIKCIKEKQKKPHIFKVHSQELSKMTTDIIMEGNWSEHTAITHAPPREPPPQVAARVWSKRKSTWGGLKFTVKALRRGTWPLGRVGTQAMSATEPTRTFFFMQTWCQHTHTYILHIWYMKNKTKTWFSRVISICTFYWPATNDSPL